MLLCQRKWILIRGLGCSNSMPVLETKLQRHFRSSIKLMWIATGNSLQGKMILEKCPDCWRQEEFGVWKFESLKVHIICTVPGCPQTY